MIARAYIANGMDFSILTSSLVHEEQTITAVNAHTLPHKSSQAVTPSILSFLDNTRSGFACNHNNLLQEEKEERKIDSNLT